MKIGIDARFYGPKTGGGGIGRYVAELVTHLQEIDHKNEYVLFLKKENFHECVITNPNFFKQLLDVHWYGIKEQWIMPKAVKRARVDFMHYPHWNVPLFSRVPFMVTIHDVILLEDPKSTRATTRGPIVHGFKYAAFRTVLENAVHRSKRIITVSEFSRGSILKHFGIHPSKISVVHNGVLPPKDSGGVSLTGLGVYEPYFLYVGNAYPHKNLELMLEAFKNAAKQHRYVQLVLAGKRNVFSEKLEQKAYDMGIPAERIRFVDFPSDEELSALYKHASLFVFPSRIEGFGIPPLEAMAAGTPVAAAESSSLPEVLGDAAHFFDPDDAHKLTRIMLAALKHPERIKRTINAGKEQVKKFTWHNAAKQTLKTYQTFTRLHA